MVVDGITTRELRLNYPEIINAIYAVRDGIMPRFARGKYPDNYSTAGVSRQMAGCNTSQTQPEFPTPNTGTSPPKPHMMKKLEQKKLVVYTELIKKDLDTLNDIESKRGL
jgi:hypothetical protein